VSDRDWFCEREEIMFIGIDPGRFGGFALLDKNGGILRLWKMPLTDGQPCACGIAETYREIRDCLNFCDEPKVFIERIYTTPTDSLGKRSSEKLIILSQCTEKWIKAEGEEKARAATEVEEYHKKIKNLDFKNLKITSRTELENFAVGSGRLEMCAMWGWPIKRIHPSVWARKMKPPAGYGKSTKQRSIEAAEKLWPEVFNKEAEVSFFTEKKNAPHDGLVEAALIAEYGRIYD